MRKQKKINIGDTNLANFGSDLEKSIKRAASKTEKAWTNAGQKVGVQVWRIEQFQVKEWKDVGTFYSGDSFIVLHTFKQKSNRFQETADKNKLNYNIHFWLGLETSQDEAGTAAYKTVELDDYLGGVPVQYREVESSESAGFVKLFPAMKILEGGTESGFNHVKPKEYVPRLLEIKGRLNVRITQVPLAVSSMCHDDAFVVDAGEHIYQWNGRAADPREKARAGRYAKSLVDFREGRAELEVLEAGQECAALWALLGASPDQVPEHSHHLDEQWDTLGTSAKKLFRYSVDSSSGKVALTALGEGASITRDSFESAHAYVFDAGYDVFLWIGRDASKETRSRALQVGQEYLRQNQLPVERPICRLLEGGENETFEESFGFVADAAAFKRAQSSKWKTTMGGWVDKDGHSGIAGTPQATNESQSDTTAFFNDSSLSHSAALQAAQRLLEATQRFFKDKQILVDEIAPRSWLEIGQIAIEFEQLHPSQASLREALDQAVYFKFRRTLLGK